LNKSQNSSALVTGGAGFIGSHVAEMLAQRGYRVTILDDLSGGVETNLPSGCDFVEGSVCHRRKVESLFEERKFDYVFHLAAYAAEGLSPFIRSFNYENNLVGSIHLINCAVRYKVRRFVFTSSIAVYGKGQTPLLESTTPQPEDPYGISKYAVEMDLKCAHELFGLQYTIFRPHNVYGERQNIEDPFRNVIGIFMKRIMKEEALPVFGDGSQMRAFSYIKDVAVPIVDCIELESTAQEVFNVGADEPYTVNTLAQAVMKAMDHRVDIVHLAPRLEVMNAFSDHSKARKFFPNLEAPVDLETGLARMAAWAKSTKHSPSKMSMQLEIAEKLPESWKVYF
jgi:UDP-glucose 4-epimerase